MSSLFFKYVHTLWSLLAKERRGHIYLEFFFSYFISCIIVGSVAILETVSKIKLEVDQESF